MTLKNPNECDVLILQECSQEEYDSVDDSDFVWITGGPDRRINYQPVTEEASKLIEKDATTNTTATMQRDNNKELRDK